MNLYELPEFPEDKRRQALLRLPSFGFGEVGQEGSKLNFLGLIAIPCSLSPIPYPLCLILIFDKDLTEPSNLIETHPRCPWWQTTKFAERLVKIPVTGWGVI